MKEKIKAVLSAIFEYVSTGPKAVILAIIAPIAAIIVYIIALKDKTVDLKEDLAVSENELALASALQKRKEADDKAKEALGDYVSLRDIYLKQQQQRTRTPSGSDPGDDAA